MARSFLSVWHQFTNSLPTSAMHHTQSLNQTTYFSMRQLESALTSHLSQANSIRLAKLAGYSVWTIPLADLAGPSGLPISMALVWRANSAGHYAWANLAGLANFVVRLDCPIWLAIVAVAGQSGWSIWSSNLNGPSGPPIGLLANLLG